MPDEWRETSLADVATYINGYPFKPTELGSKGLPVIRIKQLLNPAEPVDRHQADIPRRHHIDTGDLVFSWSGTLAVRLWDRGPALLNQHLFKVVERPGVDRKWLAVALDHSLEQLSERTHGSTMHHLTKPELALFSIALPPLAEQRRIADLIGALDRAIDALRQTEAAVRGLYSALQDEVFRVASRRLPLRDVAEVVVGPAFASISFTEDASDPRLLRGINVGAGSVRWDATKRWPRTDEAKYSRYGLRSDDVVVAMDATFTAAGEMRVARLGPTDLPALLVQRVARLRPSSDVTTPGLLYHLLRSAQACAGLRDAQTGAFAPHISADDIRATSLPVLSMLEAPLWDGIMEVADEQASAARDCVAAAARLRAALLADLMLGHQRIPASYDRLIDPAA